MGALFAILSAATFGFNSASARRALISSTVFQALAITVPMGVPLFLIAALLLGQGHAILGILDSLPISTSRSRESSISPGGATATTARPRRWVPT